MLEFKKCCCYQCPLLKDAASRPDCACEDVPVYSQSQCMDCPKRHFCDVTKQPQEYLDESPSATHNTGSPKLPTLEECENATVNSDNDRIQILRDCAVVKRCYDYICRQLRGGCLSTLHAIRPLKGRLLYMAARKKQQFIITVESSRNPLHLRGVFENLVRQQSSIDYLDNWSVEIVAADIKEAGRTVR